jgi:putative Mg2+ transporter-C (MgtC) family protein
LDSITITPWIELDMVIRLIIAAVVGGIIGYERESAEKPAGLRTLILVCVGAALFTMASVSFGLMSDPSRIAAGIVVGVGFLGAGTIIHGRGGIVGLTTAAGIWVVAAVGMAVGAGLYLVAGVTTVIVVIALRLPRLPHSHR